MQNKEISFYICASIKEFDILLTIPLNNFYTTVYFPVLLSNLQKSLK